MTETTTEKSILLLIALMAAILSALTSSAEIKGQTDGIHEGTADFDLSESINSTANSIPRPETMLLVLVRRRRRPASLMWTIR